jgi:hypothetical protein
LSKRSKPTGGHKRPRKHVFYLDRNLCSDGLIHPLRDAGYDLVAYSDEHGRIHNQRISDPEIIAQCGERKHILITGDRKLEYTYAAEIYSARIGVVLLASNNDGVKSWRKRLITARSAILEQIGKRKKPYLMRVSMDGTLTTLRLYRKGRSSSLRLD